MSKKIVFCSDGTWNDEATNTNVYKIFKAMNFSADQCPIYDDGVGSDGDTLLRLLGGAFGDGLDKKISDGYTRISHLYEKGDQVFLFGFSRGAYTARSLAGMIAICGLPTQNVDDNLTTQAFQAYRQHDMAQRQKMLASLNQTYALDCAQIIMVGVWDTVGALGIPAIFGGIDTQRYGFLDTKLHPDVKNAYHAVSVDERRREFPATLWSAAAPGQTIEQVYFTGVHCDVGGGYPETGLSDITLSWMMGKAAALGVEFDPTVYQQYSNIDAKHSLDQKHESWSARWGFPCARVIADNAAISNSVQIRLQHDASYEPANLKQNAGVLAPSYSIVPTVSLAAAAAAGAGAGASAPSSSTGGAK
ncbi:MAG: DUF2235 domain-containing protein [Candidatus Korobacteraceae bacterium]